MQDLNENWIIDVLYDLSNAALKCRQFDLSEDISTVAAAYDALPERLHDHSLFMIRFFDQLPDFEKKENYEPEKRPT